MKANYERKQDIELYIVKNKELKEERDLYKVKIDTINRIYKSKGKSILIYMNDITKVLKQRLVKISKNYSVSELDKKYILDLIFILGFRLSHEDLKDLETCRFFELKPIKASIKECSDILLDLINNSSLFREKMFDESKNVLERSNEVYSDFRKFIAYSYKLLSK
jgi:hypothetical protein